MSAPPSIRPWKGAGMQQLQINYAPAPPAHRRQRLARRAAFVIVAAIVVVLAIRSGPSAWRHAEILYCQHRAMTYSAPADKVVYDDDPSDTTKLRAGSPSMTAGADGEVFEFAKPWERLNQFISRRLPSATCFLHERTSANGDRFLLMVELRRGVGIVTDSQKYQIWDFDYVLVKPGGLSQLPEDVSPEHGASLTGESALGAVARARCTRWYAGQPDAKDPSHFTIHGVSDGKPLQLNGWLRNGHIKMELH